MLKQYSAITTTHPTKETPINDVSVQKYIHILNTASPAVIYEINLMCPVS